MTSPETPLQLVDRLIRETEEIDKKYHNAQQRLDLLYQIRTSLLEASKRFDDVIDEQGDFRAIIGKDEAKQLKDDIFMGKPIGDDLYKPSGECHGRGVGMEKGSNGVWDGSNSANRQQATVLNVPATTTRVLPGKSPEGHLVEYYKRTKLGDLVVKEIEKDEKKKTEGMRLPRYEAKERKRIRAEEL